MKSLATLIKLQKTYVDEQRILLATLQTQLDKVEKEIRNLRAQREAQKQLVEEDSSLALTYGDYLKAAIQKGKELERKRAIAQEAVNIAFDKLAELFEEQKRYEIAEENRIEDERREELKKETATLDEVGSIGFVRKKKT